MTTQDPIQNWRITVGGYGSFEFTGTKAEAEEMRVHKARWEGAIAHKHPIATENGYCQACRPKEVPQ